MRWVAHDWLTFHSVGYSWQKVSSNYELNCSDFPFRRDGRDSLEKKGLGVMGKGTQRRLRKEY